MNRILHIFFFLSILIGINAQTPNYCMSAPEGYAAGVTGGGTPTETNTVTVTTSSGFETALSGTKPIIIVSGTLTFSSQLSKSFSNKTILGLPGARMVNNTQTASGSGILYLSGGTNIIIRNIIFEGPGAYDVDGNDNLSLKGASRVWIDHCEFQDGIDDCFDITGTSDNVTVSWCKFSHLKPAKAGGSGGAADHRYSNLIGGSDTDKPSDGRYSITWQNCWWADGNKDRMVRGRNVQLHILNCYWSSQVASNNISLTSGDIGSTCYVEGGIFACTGKPAILDIPRNANGTPKTTIPTVPFNVKFVDCFKADGITIPSATLLGGATNPGTLAAPTYLYNVYPSSQVVAAVTNPICGAGATLQVTSKGNVSSACIVSAVDEYYEPTLRYYPIQIDNVLNIDIPDIISRNLLIHLYSINGQCVYSYSVNTEYKKTISLNLSNLSAGIYFARVHFDGRTECIKVQKK